MVSDASVLVKFGCHRTSPSYSCKEFSLSGDKEVKKTFPGKFPAKVQIAELMYPSFPYNSSWNPHKRIRSNALSLRILARMSKGRSFITALAIMRLVPQILVLLSLFVSVKSSAGFRVAKPNCMETCGGVHIPFPFGIGPGCFLDEWYEVVCWKENNSTSVPRLSKIGLDGLHILLPTGRRDGWINVSFPLSYSSLNCTDNAGVSPSTSPSLAGSNFVFSQDLNIFTAVGCEYGASLNSTNSAFVGCKSECREGSNMSRFSDCSGSAGCCQNTIPSNLQAFNISFTRVAGATASGDGCAYAFLVDRSWFRPKFTDLYSLGDREYVPVLLGWGIANDTRTWTSLMNGRSKRHYYCSSYSQASYSFDRLPYSQCICGYGYEGNPYLGEECEDIDECKDPTLNRCSGKCVNTRGYYKCVDGSRTVKLAMMVIGGFIGAILFLLSLRWLRRTVKRRKKMKLKQKFFKQNGGLLLQQQLTSPEGNVEKSKLFDSKELERATDNFNENRILGQGGQGTVYKGMLIDGRIVAVKKSIVLEEGNVEQFINEVFILSQINHRNVVKLLGCCLETKVPLLVYEFIPNGTLYQYLHDPNEEFPVPWDVRLRIASEVAGALFYLHSAASTPIYHRDIKSTNILLDEKYQAKIADFGTSRSVALDQTHVTTLVQGTFGYLDPEYFQSSQFTDKSDVYSFGVVLVELLTGQKPISLHGAEEGRSLATYFILSMENDHLFDIVDAQIMDQGNKGDITAVAHLARRCLDLNGRKRPTMREVATELEAIRRASHPYDVQAVKERCGNLGIDGIEAHDVGFRSTGFESGDAMTSTTDVYPLLSSDTW